MRKNSFLAAIAFDRGRRRRARRAVSRSRRSSRRQQPPPAGTTYKPDFEIPEAGRIRRQPKTEPVDRPPRATSSARRTT